MPPKPRFSADEMLGSLARWLRIMGYDTTYTKDRGDNEILSSCKAEGRILLTRDEELARRASPSSLFIMSDELDSQLLQVRETYHLVSDESAARCTLCNGQLQLIQKEEAKGEVPPGALENHQEFSRCSTCGKLYWKGSHWDNIRKRLFALEAQTR